MFKTVVVTINKFAANEDDNNNNKINIILQGKNSQFLRIPKAISAYFMYVGIKISLRCGRNNIQNSNLK